MAPIEKINANELNVAGNLSVRDVVEALELRIRDHELDSTVAGLILEQEGRIPDQGDTVVWRDLRFTVTEMIRRRISRVHVKYEGAREDGVPADTPAQVGSTE